MFVDRALAPLKGWLESPDVIEICVNRPGEVFIERLGGAEMERFAAPDLTAAAIVNLAQRVAAMTAQHVNAETPILSAVLPDGERFQAVLPPAASEGGAIAIRKQVVRELSLGDYERDGRLSRIVVARGGRSPARQRLVEFLEAGRFREFFEGCVRGRETMLISGGTGTGKTTFANALLKEVPPGERLISLEDTRELRPPHANFVSLLASRGGQGRAKVTIQQLLEAVLRLRPDRVFLGELRGAEAFSFLRAVNTGHPGSLTTVHANSPDGAYQQIALMVMQAGVQLARAEVVDYIRHVVPVVVQLGRVGNEPGGIEEVFCGF